MPHQASARLSLCLCYENGNSDTHTGRALFTYPIDHHKLLNVMAIDFDAQSWDSEHSIRPATYAELDRLFTGWGEPARNLIGVHQHSQSTVLL